MFTVKRYFSLYLKLAIFIGQQYAAFQFDGFSSYTYGDEQFQKVYLIF